MLTLLRNTSQGRTLDGLGSYESLPRNAIVVSNTVMIKAMIGRIVGGENPSHPSYFEVFACCGLGDSGVH